MTTLKNREQVKDRITLFNNQILRLANIYGRIYKSNVRDNRLFRIIHLQCRAIEAKKELKQYLKGGYVHGN